MTCKCFGSGPWAVAANELTLTTTLVALECCDSFDDLQDRPMTLIDRSTGRPNRAMTDSPDSPGIHEVSRRGKLRKLQELGIDPWGGRFDDHLAIGDIRAREGEIRVTPPEPDASRPRALMALVVNN